MDNRLVLVVGHGRSGTSLFTIILKALGAHVPQPEVEPDETNPRGFGEPRWAVDFHTAVLRRANVHPADSRPVAWSKTEQAGQRPKVREELAAWLSQELASGSDVVVKDPRLLWFLPLWGETASQLGADVRYATMLRRPQEVLKSRAAAYGTSRPNTAIAAAWINSMLHVEAATRSSVRTMQRFDDLLADWERVVRNTCKDLDLDLLERASSAQIDDVNRLVDPTLRRAKGGWEDLDVAPEVARMADETWELLDALASADGAQAQDLTTALDGMRSRYDAFYNLSELVAESSITAARRAGVKAGKAQGG